MKKQTDDFTPPQLSKEDSFNVLSSPYWIGVFVLIALPFFAGFFYLGTMALDNWVEARALSNEQRSAIYSLLAGIASDQFLRRWLYVGLAIIRKPVVPFIMIWIFGCVGVITFEPMKNFGVWFS